ncbi:TrmH family RNA methyltransferase, partial [Actinomyces sp. oral taxon 448]|uniref:TrmH family RNA methyltransferase n=1 Tax=Actinomyces sp. oral taxon 448 TaxID=712124 RepID=UPI0025C54C65
MSSPRAVRVRRVAGLARRQARVKHRRFLVEGPQGVREAVRCAAEHVHDVYLTPETAERHGEILAEAEAAGLHTHMAAPEVVGAMSTDAQGVIAVVGTGALAGGAGLGDVLTGAHLVAVLTQTQDPGNAGTIIRTADAAGADAVVLVRGGVDPTGPKVVRATAGSLFQLPVLAG